MSEINGFYQCDNVNYSQTIRPKEFRLISSAATHLRVFLSLQLWHFALLCVCVCVIGKYTILYVRQRNCSGINAVRMLKHFLWSFLLRFNPCSETQKSLMPEKIWLFFARLLWKITEYIKNMNTSASMEQNYVFFFFYSPITYCHSFSQASQ